MQGRRVWAGVGLRTHDPVISALGFEALIPPPSNSPSSALSNVVGSFGATWLPLRGFFLFGHMRLACAQRLVLALSDCAAVILRWLVSGCVQACAGMCAARLVLP